MEIVRLVLYSFLYDHFGISWNTATKGEVSGSRFWQYIQDSI